MNRTPIRVFDQKIDIPIFGTKAGDQWGLIDSVLFHRDIAHKRMPIHLINQFDKYFSECYTIFVEGGEDSITSVTDM